MRIFGTYPDAPKPYALNGQPGWFSVPAGRNWYQVTDKGQQIWVSPNPIVMVDGAPTGAPLYAAELNQDGTLVFQDQMASRQLNIDSPPRDRLSQFT
jgi:hypothetical protein